MPHAALTLLVRDCVLQLFSELGIDASEELRETVLIRGGMYCGRRFEAVAGTALWFVEEDQVKILNGSGKVLRVVDHVSTWQRPLRAAA